MRSARQAIDPSELGASLPAAVRRPRLRDERRRLLERLEADPSAELHLELAYVEYLGHDFESAREHAEIAYREFRRDGDRRRGALAAAALGRIHFEGFDNQAAARGWFARGRTMLADEGECVERGWVELGLVGCSVTDVGALAEKAAVAVDLARRFDDVDLESKALADEGLALVSLGRTDEGMELIDEAMAIVSTGEVRPFAATQVACCTLTACERAGDLARADAWLRALDQARIAAPDAETRTLFAHCQAAYGTLLCHVGRWSEAETALTLSLAASRGGFYHQRAMARGALADLRIRQGRLEEAERLLAECGDRWETKPARARLHLARGELDLAAAAIRQALREIGPDRVRAVPLLVLMADVELGRTNVEAAAAAAARATEIATEAGIPHLIAQAALARGRVRRAEGDDRGAVAEYEEGLRIATRTDALLVRGQLHLDLARAEAELDPAAAVSDAESAFAIYGRLGAPEAEQCVTFLRRLGVRVSWTPPARPPDPLDLLTRRERDVLRLVGQGLSNPEIAARLFISPKTAEHHVSSILAKLGLRSRVEVAAITLPPRGRA